jgi:hypothetical protein
MIEKMNSDKKLINQVIDDVTASKRVFIKPKGLMNQSIENDAQYLLALGNFIQESQKQIQKFQSQNKTFEASQLQVQVLDAIAKYQANENLLNEKKTHYDNVFLPMYESQLKESNEKFVEVFDECLEAVKTNESHKSEEVQKILNYLKKEIKTYQDYLDKEEEFDAHTFRILKRLLSKLNEEILKAKA